MPAADRVQRLAAFFGVDSGYFMRSEPSETAGKRSEDDIDAELRRMLDDPWLIQVARRSAGMGRTQKEALLQMIDAARKLVDADKAALRQGRADSEPGDGDDHDVEGRRSGDRRRGGGGQQTFSGGTGTTDAETTKQ